MESLLILLAIVALQVGAAWLKKRVGKSKNPSLPEDESPEEYLDEREERNDSPSDAETSDSLQDLIRKFREEQAKALDDSEGTAEETLSEYVDEPIPEELPKPEPSWSLPVHPSLSKRNMLPKGFLKTAFRALPNRPACLSRKRRRKPNRLRLPPLLWINLNSNGN